MPWTDQLTKIAFNVLSYIWVTIYYKHLGGKRNSGLFRPYVLSSDQGCFITWFIVKACAPITCFLILGHVYLFNAFVHIYTDQNWAKNRHKEYKLSVRKMYNVRPSYKAFVPRIKYMKIVYVTLYRFFSQRQKKKLYSFKVYYKMSCLVLSIFILCVHFISYYIQWVIPYEEYIIWKLYKVLVIQSPLFFLSLSYTVIFLPRFITS